jgi:hypothetical protein
MAALTLADDPSVGDIDKGASDTERTRDHIGNSSYVDLARARPRMRDKQHAEEDQTNARCLGYVDALFAQNSHVQTNVNTGIAPLSRPAMLDGRRAIPLEKAK